MEAIYGIKKAATTNDGWSLKRSVRTENSHHAVSGTERKRDGVP